MPCKHTSLRSYSTGPGVSQEEAEVQKRAQEEAKEKSKKDGRKVHTEMLKVQAEGCSGLPFQERGRWALKAASGICTTFPEQSLKELYGQSPNPSRRASKN